MRPKKSMNIRESLTSRELVMFLKAQCHDCSDDWKTCDGINWTGFCEIHKFKDINPTHSRCGNRRDIGKDINKYCRTCLGLEENEHMDDCESSVCIVRKRIYEN